MPDLPFLLWPLVENSRRAQKNLCMRPDEGVARGGRGFFDHPPSFGSQATAALVARCRASSTSAASP
jgi:hypothetical protein